MVSDPGTRWEYGINIDWVGALVARLSGQSLESYVRERILDRLGMADTGYVPGEAQLPRRAHRHVRQPDGSLVASPLDPPPRPPSFNGGGGLHSTGPDYVRFLRMLLGGGELEGVRILRPETVAEMARNQLGELQAGVMESFDPTLSYHVELFPGMPKRWGLGGLITTRDVPGGRRAGSWAWAGLYNTYFWLDPTEGVAGVLLTQVLPFADPVVLELLGEFERAVYAAR
jgi:CubicO group peptidase (beta-lactamase class C family)